MGMPMAAGALRHRVVSLPSPGMAAEDAENSKPGSWKNTMFFNRLQEVFGTGRREPAARPRAADEMQNRGDEALITTDEKTDDLLHGAEAAGFKSSPSRRAT